MKNIRGLLLFLLALALTSIVRAAPPSYAGNTFDGLQTATDDASLYFGVLVALAIVVTGFFLGRKWLKSV